MRGTLGEGRRGIAEGRIIPAYAGNTPRFPIGRGAMWDHPRVCGEHGRFLLDLRLLQGSSPRMRGTHDLVVHLRSRPGIIPAYAGNTGWPAVKAIWNSDHPRVCGEHSLTALQPREMTGSSPRMRGTPAMFRACPALSGIIPAYAGNTCSGLAWCRVQWDHPRVCGEHTASISINFMYWGSSPRMRGTLIIRSPFRKTPWDHPRVCGEHRTCATNSRGY